MSKVAKPGVIDRETLTPATPTASISVAVTTSGTILLELDDGADEESWVLSVEEARDLAVGLIEACAHGREAEQQRQLRGVH